MKVAVVVGLLLILVAPQAVRAHDVTAVLVGAGDIASCSTDEDELTAQLVETIPDAAVFTLGDNVYVDGTADEWANCYDPTWGRFLDRTRPIPGNHDYNTGTAQPYFDYFGALAGPCCRGYYSYDIGGWRVYALNSETQTGRASAQYAWLRKKLNTEPHTCTIAMWHKPLWSSTRRGTTKMAAMTTLLYNKHAELILNGHIHGYERMAPANPSGQPDPLGIRQITAGTGGRQAENADQWINPPLAISEVRDNTYSGVLRLDLSATSYSWQFLATDGSTVDSGADVCHP